jgi:hypothetical protein
MFYTHIFIRHTHLVFTYIWNTIVMTERICQTPSQIPGIKWKKCIGSYLIRNLKIDPPPHLCSRYVRTYILLLPLQSALQPLDGSQQEGFTKCRCQRHVKPPTWRRTRDLERSNFRHKRPTASKATLANPAAEGGTMGEKWPREFCWKWRLPRHFWVLLHAVKHDMRQTALLPLRRKAYWGFFRPKNPTASDTKGQHATSTPPKPLHTYYCYNFLSNRMALSFVPFYIQNEQEINIIKIFEGRWLIFSSLFSNPFLNICAQW